MRPQVFLPAMLACFLWACSEQSATYSYDPDSAVYHKFSGDLAMAHVEKMVGFGPRPAGSEALETTRQYIEAELKALGWQTQRQSFEAETPTHGPITFVNLRARFPGDAKENLWTRPYQVLIGSHYETKLYENIVFVGANDAGSSTGALIEIARVMAERPPLARACELVFFDGEEAIGANINDVDGLYGSRHYAQQVRKAEASQRPDHGLILDMIGDKNLNVGVPADSPLNLYQKLMAAAKDLGHSEHFGMHSSPIIDDHVPLNAIGIPTLDIIDLDFRPWHTAGDTLDQISADSLRIAGATTLLLIEKYLLSE